MSRSRYRVGRNVNYLPTTTEAAAFGEGPYPARVTRVNNDGSVQLHVDTPPGASTAGTIDGTYGQDPEGDILEALRDLSELRLKSSVTFGALPGQFTWGDQLS